MTGGVYVTWDDMVWYGMAWHGLAWHGMVEGVDVNDRAAWWWCSAETTAQ